MEFLLFQIQAPLASWGGPAVGEYRGSDEHPSQSALFGMLAAALGIRREQEAQLQALQNSYAFAIGVQARGSLLRDYHTAQVPSQSSLKKRPHATRREELDLPKFELGTILSNRDYRQNVRYLLALQVRENLQEPVPYSLHALRQALQTPQFVLYLGRKTCPLAAPLWPQVRAAQSAIEALQEYYAALMALHAPAFPENWKKENPPLSYLVWSEGVQAGCTADMHMQRKDRLLHRGMWQYGDRIEYRKLLCAEDVDEVEESDETAAAEGAEEAAATTTSGRAAPGTTPDQSGTDDNATKGV